MGIGTTGSILEFLQRRIAEEDLRARTSADPKVAALHAQMAALYTDRVTAMTDTPDLDPPITTRLLL